MIDMNTVDVKALVQRLGYNADGLLFIKEEDWRKRQHKYGAEVAPEDIETARMLHKELGILPNSHELIRGWVDRGFGVTIGVVRGYYIVSLDDCTDEPKWWRTLVFTSLHDAKAALLDDSYSIDSNVAAPALPPYRDIPVSVESNIAEQYNKDQVIIVTWDKNHNTTHVTTFDKTKDDCLQAAEGGNRVKKALGWPDELCHAVPEADVVSKKPA